MLLWLVLLSQAKIMNSYDINPVFEEKWTQNIWEIA